ncbi:uncharacterized protein C8A04DRAFT_26630 [Dichotomopilus funicola]|uniref:Apple domain-containing protein n=1 Tax=Dichotomopilus funicola TaxID=1934379 RepID=A0AAN6V6F6_9PEZI|nr:hypothetical protein C8A04DRAFT_26630 [Dichotomopilus funicola]
MDAPEAISGPQRSLSHKLRRQPKLEIPPPVHHSPVERSGSTAGSDDESSIKEFNLLKTEKQSTNALVGGSETRKNTTIWGLRRGKAVLVVALVIVVVLASVGGGIGGGLAASARRTSNADNPMIVMMPTTIMMPSTAVVANPTTSPSPPPAQTPTTNDDDTNIDGSTSAFTPIKVPTQGILDFDCGRLSTNRQLITLGTATWGFDVQCMMDYIGPGVDVAGMTAYTFGDCLRACAMFNRFARNNTCLGVFFSANLTTSLPMYGGNCFLKGYLPSMSAEKDLAAAAALVEAPQFMKGVDNEVVKRRLI